MANQEQLCRLVKSIEERFDDLMKDVHEAVAAGAFSAVAQSNSDYNVSHSSLFEFQRFMRKLTKSLADEQKKGEARSIQRITKKENAFAVEYLNDRDYHLDVENKNEEVVETKVEKEDEMKFVKAKEVDATCEEFLEEKEELNIDSLGEKEVEAVQENVYYLFATALATLKRAVQADVYLSRDDLRRLTDDVRKSLDDAWKERDKTDYRRGSTDCEMNKRHAIERLRFDDLTR